MAIELIFFINFMDLFDISLSLSLSEYSQGVILPSHNKTPPSDKTQSQESSKSKSQSQSVSSKSNTGVWLAFFFGEKSFVTIFFLVLFFVQHNQFEYQQKRLN